MGSLLHQSHLKFCSHPTQFFYQNPNFVPSLVPQKPYIYKKQTLQKQPTTLFALTESDSPKSLEPNPETLFQELVDSFDLPPDYFAQLPNDLRLDLNDAAFDLSKGPVIDECGQELGQLLLNLSRAWELADTSTSHTLVSKFPSLQSSLNENAKSAFGKRLLSAGRRFQLMGQYGQGEPQRIAKIMIATGKHLSSSPVSATTAPQPTQETRMFKFGELQVAITSDRANIGAAIGFVFGVLSWQLAQGIQSIPESSLQYANDNALLLAKSLRGALLAIGYSSTVLSACASIGLFLLARQLKSEEKILRQAIVKLLRRTERALNFDEYPFYDSKLKDFSANETVMWLFR